MTPVPAGSGPAAPACPGCGRPPAAEHPLCVHCGTLYRPAPCRWHRRRFAKQACLVCGAPVCADCRRGPRHAALCPEHGDVSLHGEWAELLRTDAELEASLVVDALRADGIEAHVLSQKDHANVVTFGGLSVVRVLVPAFRLREARRLLAAEDRS